MFLGTVLSTEDILPVPTSIANALLVSDNLVVRDQYDLVSGDVIVKGCPLGRAGSL